MLRKKYKLSPMRKVPYVQKGLLGGDNFWGKMVAGQWPITILALLILLFVAMPAVKNYLRQKALDREIAEVQTEISKYENSNKDLKEMVRYLESNQSVEERGRVNLGLKKQNEKVIIISRANKIENDGTATGTELDKLSNPQKWWRYFFE